MVDYTLPTVDDFYARFPSLNTSSPDRDYLVSMLLDEANDQVDSSWRAADYRPAIMYLVAHWLSTEVDRRADAGLITSESFGPMSRSYGAVTSMEDVSSTEYGRRYLSLRKKNFPSGLIV